MTGDSLGLDTGQGKEIFTLKAKSFGECNFRIAYARPKYFMSFEYQEAKGGLIITIPIQVINPLNLEDQVACDSKHEDCELKT